MVGGTKGIGLETARQFSAQGDTVVVGARQSRAEIAALANVEFMAADMGNPAAPGDLVRHAIDRHGRIDVLVNCVGGGLVRPDPNAVTDEQWLDMLTRSFLYAVRSSRVAVNQMRKPGGGSLINISSIHARLSKTDTIDYSAAKAALESYSKSLAINVAAANIRVNTVSPGPVVTPLWTDEGGLSDQFAEKLGVSGGQVMRDIAKQVPLGRFAEPGEIAAMVVFLASDSARIITGVNIRMDGGLSPAV